ncbi:unnamed protein product [Adineta steineri]|uniref:Uncharacterized protein n=1 Tax=Adineta steineri TaxID=433720 RepID=A0A819HG08_9BILA|nr:unnamed protein product [Adineta steineri]CAF3899422.1 unnamed protein product [Adineta steineri]
MLSSEKSNPSAAITKSKQKETVRHLKRIQHQELSPFYSACEKGDFIYVKEKVKTLSSDELDQLESTGETALHIATRNNRLETVRLLLRSGCSRNMYNSSGKLPYEEAQTDEMKQLFASPNSDHFFEANPQDSYGIFRPLMAIGKLTALKTTEPEQIKTTADTVENKDKPIWNQELKSEEEVMEYLTNRQALAMWIKICSWIYRRFGGCIRRREEEGNDFAPELFDLNKDRDLEKFLSSIPSNENQSIVTAKEDAEEREMKTLRQRLMSTCCCKNTIVPVPQSLQSTDTDSVIITQPKMNNRKYDSSKSMHSRLAASQNPRDFIEASKEFNSIIPLIHLYTEKNLRFYAELNKNLAIIDNNPNRGASLCDRFIREFDLKEAELAQFAFVGTTYRGTSMSMSDVINYRKASEQNPKWMIAPRAFQSTSINRVKAIEFLHSKKQDGKPVGLMVFHIPVACSTILAIKEISRYPQEDEVLIMPGNLFTITKVTQCEDDPTLPEVHLEHVKRDISFFKKLRAIFRAATTSASGIE